MGLRQFFRLIEPLEPLESLLETEFLLLYYVKGMTPERIWRMDHDDRMWWLKRLLKEKRAENKSGPQLPEE